MRGCVCAGTPRRLDPADSCAAAALLLPAVDVHRAVPVGEGSGKRAPGGMERRGARAASSNTRASHALVSSGRSHLTSGKAGCSPASTKENRPQIADLVSGLEGRRLFLRRGKEKFPRGNPKFPPKGAKDLDRVAVRNVLRAQGQAQGEIKADSEIQHEGDGDPQAGPD